MPAAATTGVPRQRPAHRRSAAPPGERRRGTGCETLHLQVEVVDSPGGARARAHLLGATASRLGRSGAGEGAGSQDPYAALHDWQPPEELARALAAVLDAALEDA